MAEFSFLLMVEQRSSVCAFATSFLSIYSLANTDCFHVLTFVNNAAVNMRVQLYLSVISSLLYLLSRSGTAGSSPSSNFSFEEPVLYSIVAAPVYISISSAQGVPFLHTLTSTFFSLIFLLIVIVTGVRWYLTVVLICISLMISVVEFHVPIGHLYIFENCLFGFFCVCIFIEMYAAAANSLQSCPTLCDPIDGSSPGSPVPAILQARTLEWVAIFFCNAWKWKVKGKSLSRVQLFATPWTAAYQAPLSMGFSRQEYWSGVPLSSPIEVYISYIFEY